jgi:FtsZ-binding cell division protein ZapB
MISLEQIQLLESRISKAIDYVQRINAENTALVSEKEGLRAKLEANQKRIDELELLVMHFKEDQGRIEDGIIAALDRLSQFEEAFGNSLKEKPVVKKTPVKPAEKKPEKPAEPQSKEVFFEIPETETRENSELLDDDLSSDGELDIF